MLPWYRIRNRATWAAQREKRVWNRLDVVTAEFTEQRDPKLATHSGIGGTEETGSKESQCGGTKARSWVYWTESPDYNKGWTDELLNRLNRQQHRATWAESGLRAQQNRTEELLDWTERAQATAKTTAFAHAQLSMLSWLMLCTVKGRHLYFRYENDDRILPVDNFTMNTKKNNHYLKTTGSTDKSLHKITLLQEFNTILL